MTPTIPSARRARHLRALLAALALTVASAACDGDAPTPPPQALFEEPVDPAIIEVARTTAAQETLRIQTRADGFACGYRQGWDLTLDHARRATPPQWRARTLGGALVTGLILFGVGVVGTFLLAWFLPRLRRRRALRGARDDDRDDAGWFSYLRHLWREAGKRLGAVLQVDYFDRAGAEARVGASHELRDAERLVTQAVDAAQRLAGDAPEPHVRAIIAALGTWRDDIDALGRLLEGDQAFRPEVNPRRILPRLVRQRRAAQSVRDELLRAEAMRRDLGPSDWEEWRQQIDLRPELPLDHRAGEPRETARWVRPVGWAGVFGVTVVLPMIAAWAAAGGFPFLLAVLIALASVGAVLTARVHLFGAGRLPLLPGLADRIAGWMTAIAFVAMVLMMASNMATAESGLDLGDPPPLERARAVVPAETPPPLAPQGASVQPPVTTPAPAR